MRRSFALPALFAIALLAPLLGIASPASAENDSGPIILTGPNAVTTDTTATFTFTNPETVQGQQCSLDGGAAFSCPTIPWTTPVLAIGAHKLSVNGSTNLIGTCVPLIGCLPGLPVSDEWDWQVIAPPTASLTAPSAPVQLSSRATVSWRTSVGAGNPAVASVQVSHRRAGINGAFGTPTTQTFAVATRSTSVSLRRGYTDCFKVRATDTAGNVGPWSPQRCTASPLDDRALTASKGWKRTKATSAYRSTLTTAKSARRTLSKTGVRAARVGLVATTCRTCGKVTIKIGTKVVGTINLRSATTRHHRLLLLPAFTPRTGKLTLTTTSRKMVRIDGVAVSPS